MTDFGNVSYPVGRKDYRCEWCGQWIPTGEKHAHFVCKWEGDFQNWRMHLECHDDANESGELTDGFMPYEHERPKVGSVTEPQQRSEPATTRRSEAP